MPAQLVSLASELPLLRAGELEARINAMQELEVSIDGVTYRDVKVVRAFPLSAEQKYIVLLDTNDEEIGIIEDVSECRPEVAELLHDILRNAYLVPEITKVNSITLKGLVPMWDVETDRGHRTLEMRSRRDISVMGNRISLRDADGNRYEVIDYTKLDPYSRRLLEREV